MHDIEKRSIEELKTRYDLEPSINDIFVEGPFDADLLTMHFSRKEQHNSIAYSIDTVNVPTELLTKYGYTLGAKQRVKAFARELSDLNDGQKFLCLVDRDLDQWLEKIEEVRRLVWTEFTSIELYFFEEKTIKEIICIVGSANIVSWNDFWDSFTDTLTTLYALRLTDAELKLMLTWPPFERDLTKKGSKLTFDLDEYIRRILISSGKAKHFAQFRSSFDSWILLLNGDPRAYIRGHDFIELIAWSIAKFGGKREMANKTIIERQIIAMEDRISLKLDALLNI